MACTRLSEHCVCNMSVLPTCENIHQLTLIPFISWLDTPTFYLYLEGEGRGNRREGSDEGRSAKPLVILMQ